MTLTITFNTTVDGVAQSSTYDRQYPSLAEFIADHAEAYNKAFGAENWSATEKTDTV